MAMTVITAPDSPNGSSAKPMQAARAVLSTNWKPKSARRSCVRGLDATHQARADASVREEVRKRDERRPEREDSEVVRREQARQNQRAGKRHDADTQVAEDIDRAPATAVA